jgi:hypothetical protein
MNAPTWIGLLAALWLTGCLLSEDPPPVNPNPPASCGNGTCDPSTESCVNCPSECDCCSAIFVTDVAGRVLNEATGQPDQTVASIGSTQSVNIVFGGGAFDIAGAPEITIHGDVQTSNIPQNNCVADVQNGAVEVWATDGLGRERLLGIWTSQSTQFDLACGQLDTAKRLTLRAQIGAQATLDAVTISTAACSRTGTR